MYIKGLLYCIPGGINLRTKGILKRILQWLCWYNIGIAILRLLSLYRVTKQKNVLDWCHWEMRFSEWEKRRSIYKIMLCPSREISQWPPGSQYPMQKQESFYYQARAGAPTRYRCSGYREEPRVLGYIAYIGYSRVRNLKNGSFWVGRHLIGYLLWKD